MKNYYKLLGLLFITGILVARSSDDKTLPAIITISQSEYTINGEQDSEVKATFGINTDWTTTISYEGSTKDWLTATPTSGKAGSNIEILFTAAANTADVEHAADLTINYGNENKNHKLTIRQTLRLATDITAHFDVKFAAKLQEKGYIPNAEKILFSDVVNITRIDVSGPDYEIRGDLTSLSGIEYFESLTELYCYFNQLTAIDISKNTALTHLDCSENQLTAIDLSKNTALTHLDCAENQLTAIDLSKNRELKWFDCSYNQLTVIDLSMNRELTYFDCSYNQLTVIDLSMNRELTYFDCSENQLTAIDISRNRELTHFDCSENQLTAIDISMNRELTWLFCRENQLMAIDVSKNRELKWLWCGGNQLTAIDVSKNRELKYLDCMNNPGIETIFVVKAWFDNNNIPSINFTQDSWTFDGETITIDYQKVI